MRAYLAAAAMAALLVGCGGKCDPSSCTGCCDASGICQAGDQITACGVQGAACAQCTGGQSCSALGACTFPAGSGGAGGTTSTGGTTTSTGGSTGLTTTGGSTGLTGTSTTGSTTTGSSTTGTSTGGGPGSLSGAHAFAVQGGIAIRSANDGGTTYGAVFVLTEASYGCAQYRADGGAPSGQVVEAEIQNSNQALALSPGTYGVGQSSVQVFGGWAILSGGTATTYELWGNGSSVTVSGVGSTFSGSFAATYPDGGAGSGTFDVPFCN